MGKDEEDNWQIVQRHECKKAAESFDANLHYEHELSIDTNLFKFSTDHLTGY